MVQIQLQHQRGRQLCRSRCLLGQVQLQRLRGWRLHPGRQLVDVVAGGSSVGFLTPFDQDAAAAWWQAEQSAVADGSLRVWVAQGTDGIAGTVSLSMKRKPNGRHRAEIVKLMVHRDARGQGLGRALLATAERAAAQAGATLLLLDTVTGSAAEHLYRAAGWTRYGIVPGYAADPVGSLEDCSFYYKQLI